MTNNLFAADERTFVEAVARLAYCNPFLPERIQLEGEALGGEFDDTGPVWSRLVESPGHRANIQRLNRRVEQVVDAAEQKLANGCSVDEPDLARYEDLVCYLLYYRYWRDLHDIEEDAPVSEMPDWNAFRSDFDRYLNVPARALPTSFDAGHLFACFYQLRRAFHHIFDFLLGSSLPAARLRASVWQSIFTHDMRRYRRSLYKRMGDMTTLVTGPSGSGKEVVARAIACSQYIPFDVKAERFVADGRAGFHPLNLAALAPTVIESELFGHCRGAFTGAVGDRIGWLEACDDLGTVFLDEIGELDASIQVKLLRVLQSRTFQRLGETEDRRFRGKIIAATNRDLAAEMKARRFREDFYYRLCSDLIMTPGLYEQIADSPEDLSNLVLFIARRDFGDEAQQVADEVIAWIDGHLGPDYRWPGNIRELEQCVRNVLIRKHYRPPSDNGPPDDDGLPQRLAARIRDGQLTAEELVRYYSTLVYAETGSYEATARRLKLDRRTVKSKIDAELLEQLGLG